MELSASDRLAVEKEILDGKLVAAIKHYREATGASLTECKDAVEAMQRDLRRERPWQFEDSSGSPGRPSRGWNFLVVLVELAILCVAAYWLWTTFLSEEHRPSTGYAVPLAPSRQEQTNSRVASPATKPEEAIAQEKVPLPRIVSEVPVISLGEAPSSRVPAEPDHSSFDVAVSPQETFKSLYLKKMARPEYEQRKQNVTLSRSYDGSLIERQIKTLRSRLTASRGQSSPGSKIVVPITDVRPTMDGKMEQGEWSRAVAIRISEDHDTVLYFQSDGKWLYVACDARAETTIDGFDQFRVYFHAGLIPELANERIHVGKGDRLTSIRETTLLWQGAPPETEEERWKRFAINDWGLYRYVDAFSDIYDRNRQYELAVYMAEAGLHTDVPFTLYAQVETDPTRRTNGKVGNRRYLGDLGSQENPVWFVID